MALGIGQQPPHRSPHFGQLALARSHVEWSRLVIRLSATIVSGKEERKDCDQRKARAGAGDRPPQSGSR